MGNPFTSIADSISDFAGDIADAWNGSPSPSSSTTSHYLSYPYDLGDGAVDSIDFDSATTDGIGTDLKAYTDARGEAQKNSYANSKDPFIMFEFFRIVEKEARDDELAGVEGKISLINGYEVDKTKSKAQQEADRESYFSGKKDTLKKLKARKAVLEDMVGKRLLNKVIALYMTPSISISDSMSYDQDSRKISALGLDIFSGDSGLGMEDVAVGAAALSTGIGAGVGSLIDKIPGGKLVSGAIGGGIGSVAGPEVLRQLGKALNPNEYMQYKSTQLRTFSFQWKFLPDSQKESSAANEIIKAFRAAAHAHKKSVVTLTVPDQVVVSFHGVENMVNLPSTVISNVSVTYNPNAASFFKVDGAPVEIDLSVSLSEIVPIYRDDVEKKGY